MKKYYVFTVILTLFTLLLLVFGFDLSGSPFEAKKISNDTKRVQDIVSLRSSIQLQYDRTLRLVTNLEQLENSATDNIDPSTKLPYEYAILSPSSYRICTTFETDAKKNPDNTNYLKYGPMQDTMQVYLHSKGRQCFIFSVGNVKSTTQE